MENKEGRFTEELLGGGGLDDLDDSGTELLDGGNVAGEDTHISRDGGDVDLGDRDILEDGLLNVKNIYEVVLALR